VRRNTILFIVVTFCLAILLSPAIKAQQKGQNILKDDVIKANPRHPQQQSNRYLDNNEKKKKLKTSYKLVSSNGCPSYMQFTSKPQKEREKMLRKNKRG